MTDKPFPITYRLESDDKSWPAPPEYITFLARYLPVKVKGKLTGEDKLDILPVRFVGPSRVVSEAKAMTFWDYETAKKQQQQERGRALGKARART